MSGLPLRSLLIPLLTMGLLQQPTVAQSASQLALKAYSAKYQVSKGSFVIGTTEISLKLSGQNRYTYNAYTIPVGLAAIFRKDEISERSQGQIINDAIVPSQYLYSHKKPKKRRRIHLDFNWETHRVANQTTDSHWSMKIPDGTQDKFSQQLALILALCQGEKKTEFMVADGGLLKSYRYIEVSREQIRTSLGKYQTIKIVRIKDGRPSNTTLWFAPNLNYLPIKIVKHDEEGSFTMELISVSWQDQQS